MQFNVVSALVSQVDFNRSFLFLELNREHKYANDYPNKKK